MIVLEWKGRHRYGRIDKGEMVVGSKIFFKREI